MLESLGLGIIPTMLLAPAVGLGGASSFREGVIHQEVDFPASPERIYEALMSDREFRAFSGADAKIQGDRGGVFTLFDGRVIGCNVELIPNQQIVQAWRMQQWPPGVYSIVRFDLSAPSPAAAWPWNRSASRLTAELPRKPGGPGSTGARLKSISEREFRGVGAGGPGVSSSAMMSRSFGTVAQLVEQGPFKALVLGSSPSRPTFRRLPGTFRNVRET